MKSLRYQGKGVVTWVDLPDPTPGPGQVLVRTDMPCRGIGECGLCAVRTTRGWQHACTDGPVFQLKELHHVAQ